MENKNVDQELVKEETEQLFQELSVYEVEDRLAFANAARCISIGADAA